jgi:hypothetical protein
LLTSGSTGRSLLGDAAPAYRLRLPPDRPSPTWDFWRRIAARGLAFGRPDVFGAHTGLSPVEARAGQSGGGKGLPQALLRSLIEIDALPEFLLAAAAELGAPVDTELLLELPEVLQREATRRRR